MSIQYPGGTIVNATFTGTVKQDIVSNLETQLVNAGWSVVSGSGSTDVLLSSASTPTAANSIRVRLRSTNLTNCACINMQNAAGLKVSRDFYLLPGAAKSFRVVANKYQWFCFTAGSSPAREFVGMGTLYIPTFLHGVITGDLGWINGNSNSDSSTSVTPSFREQLHCLGETLTNATCVFSALCNNNLVECTSGAIAPNNTGLGGIRLVTAYPATSGVPASAYRWHDDSVMISDPLIAWGVSSNPPSDEAKIKGQLWGAMITSSVHAADTVFTSVDGHNWIAITAANAGTVNDAAGTLFVATT